MKLQEKVELTEKTFKQAIEKLGEALNDGEEMNDKTFKAAVTLANAHVKLINAQRATEALAFAKERLTFDWNVAISENKDELKRLLGARK